MTVMPVEDFHRDTAFEAVARRRARGNPHELWALLQTLARVQPQVMIDIGGPGVGTLWAWWMVGAQVYGVVPTETAWSESFGSGLPNRVVTLIGDRRDRATRLRLVDQLAGRKADVLVLAAATDEAGCRADFDSYTPLVRDGGLVLLHGIASPQTPGVARFWSSLNDPGRRELVGQAHPVGYGIVELHGRDRENHG